MPDEDIEDIELGKLIKKAQGEPGTTDLMVVYKQYQEVMGAHRRNLIFLRPRHPISITAGTS